MKSEPDWMNEEEDFGYCNWLLTRRGYWMLEGGEIDCEVCPVRFCCWHYDHYEDPLDKEAMESLDMEDPWDYYSPEPDDLADLATRFDEEYKRRLTGNFDDAASDFAYDAARERKAKGGNVGSRKWR